MLRTTAIRSVEALTRLQRGGGRLLVLIYHRVLPAPDPMYPYDPDAAVFAAQMTALARDFRVLPLGAAVRQLRAGTLPPGAVSVSFDDGFADNATCALPVLRRLGLSATFFIATGYLDGGCMFNDLVIEACRRAPEGRWRTGTAELGDVEVGAAASRCALAYRLIAQLKYLEPAVRSACAAQLLESLRVPPPAAIMMTRQQVRSLGEAGMEVGGHTRNHPILARLDERSAEREIADGKAELEAIMGHGVNLFAYPNGRPDQDYTARDVELVRRAGFTAAVSTEPGYADARSDLLQLPRVGSWGDRLWRYSGRLALARRGKRGAGCSGNAGAGSHA